MFLSPERAEIHVQQIGGAVDIEGARRNAVSGIVGVFGITITSAGEYEKHVACADAGFQTGDQLGDATVQSEIGVAHLLLTFCHGPMVVGAGIISQTEQVGNHICTHHLMVGA